MLGFASSFFIFNKCYLCNKNVENNSKYNNKSKYNTFVTTKYLCDKCFKKLETYKLKDKVEERIMDDVWIEYYYIFKYEKYIRKLILDYKFFDKSYLGKVFTEFIIRQKNLYKKFESYDIIIPVPMYKDKKKIRGYNQTEIIAANICLKCKNLFYGNKIIVKVKDTKKQSLLNKSERLYNVKGAYKIQEKYFEFLKNKQVIIFDDIYTTGATINECIEILKKAKVKRIFILILAKD